jgi:hypothetical protein
MIDDKKIDKFSLNFYMNQRYIFEEIKYKSFENVLDEEINIVDDEHIER